MNEHTVMAYSFSSVVELCKWKVTCFRSCKRITSQTRWLGISNLNKNSRKRFRFNGTLHQSCLPWIPMELIGQNSSDDKFWFKELLCWQSCLWQLKGYRLAASFLIRIEQSNGFIPLYQQSVFFSSIATLHSDIKHPYAQGQLYHMFAEYHPHPESGAINWVRYWITSLRVDSPLIRVVLGSRWMWWSDSDHFPPDRVILYPTHLTITLLFACPRGSDLLGPILTGKSRSAAGPEGSRVSSILIFGHFVIGFNPLGQCLLLNEYPGKRYCQSLITKFKSSSSSFAFVLMDANSTWGKFAPSRNRRNVF